MIAAVEGFAIGGHCQILLTMDYTIATEDAYLYLPRKEGIAPAPPTCPPRTSATASRAKR